MNTTRPAFCDLHTHSHFSDGSLSPAALVALAAERSLGALALTDHNTVEGLPAFLDAARKTPCIPVPGVELSAVYRTVTEREVELHILALFLPEAAFPAMAEFTREYSIRKEESTRALIHSLRRLGYPLDHEVLKATTPNGNLNRAHIAAELVRLGYVQTIQEALTGILSKKTGYYIPPPRPSVADTIAFVRSVGAVAVVAHPFLNMTPTEIEAFLPEAKAHGLEGMETRYVTYDKDTTRLAISLAARYGLAESGGSDFHGTIKPGIALGIGRGDLQVPMAVYERLAAMAGT